MINTWKINVKKIDIMELIDKSAVVAWIEGLISNGQTKLKESEECKDYESYVALAERIATCINVLSFLDTLEVKDVDLLDGVHGTVDFPFIGYDFPNIYPNYKELKEYCNRKGIKDNDKVKMIIIKDA